MMIAHTAGDVKIWNQGVETCNARAVIYGLSLNSDLIIYYIFSVLLQNTTTVMLTNNVTIIISML